jgi:selenocysteine lyase/cysteine desulfurase
LLRINSMVRVGPVHYNTLEELERFGEVLGRIAAGVA